MNPAPSLRLKLETFVSNIGTFYLSPWAQPSWISQKVPVSALAEPLAQLLRLVGSGLKFCK